MSNRHRISTGLAITLTLLASASVAHAEVSGTFTVDGKPIQITQAYAYATKGFFDPKLQDVVVVLCDVAVPPEASRDASARRQLSKAGKLHCVEQTINTKKEVINFTAQHEKFKVPEGGGSTYQVFEAKTFDGKTIAGRSHTTAPQKSFDDVPYSYDITFSLPIAPK